MLAACCGRVFAWGLKEWCKLRPAAGMALLAALACNASAHLAQALPQAELQLSEYQKQNWQVEDGLPENKIRMIAQRPDGTLLIATASGVSTFDGLHFRPMAISSGDASDDSEENEAVNAVLPVSNDEFWIGTDGRGVLHQTPSGTVNISEQAGRLNERIRNFDLDSGGVLWIATQNGIERYVKGHLEVLPQGGVVAGDITSPFAEDGKGGMFYITSAGLFDWNNGVVKPLPLPVARGERIEAIYRDLQGRLWVGTSSRILQLVPTNEPLHPEVRVRATVPSAISTLMGDKAGNLWIGTHCSGLLRLNDHGLSAWGSRNGMPDDAISTLFVDDEQNLWIGMLSRGLSRWHKGSLAPYGAPEGFPATYTANVLADNHGDLWLGTWDKGLFRRHHGQLIPTNPPSLPQTTPIRALAEDRKGQIWVGTWFDGVYRYNGHGFQHYLLGTESPVNAVSALLTASDGGLWTGTYTGLLYFPSGEPSPKNRTLFLDSQRITCLVEDRDGSVLAGTNKGLFRIHDGKSSPVDGLEHAHILSLSIDSGGYIWVGTRAGGLSAIVNGHVVQIPHGAGVPDFAVSTAIEDDDSHLWLGTSRGIVRISLPELHALADGVRTSVSSVILDKADGMRSSECSGPSMPVSARTADGTLWFVTSNGFVRTTDVAEKLENVQPVAKMLGWTPSYDRNSADLIPTSSSPKIDLEAGHADLLLYFNAKDLSNPSHVEFRYRLSGYDSTWTTTHARMARYQHLPAGNYLFEVQARRGSEGWSGPVASIAVKQRPYFYETWYFYGSILLVIAIAAAQLMRRREQLMRGRIGIILEERSRIARECHDTLMAGFAAVSWQLEATAKLFRDSNAENTPPAESCELARSMVAHCQAEARRIIWDLRDTDEVTSVLSHALARTLSENMAPKTIDVSFDVDGDEVPLAPGCVHHLVCIGQEAVSNAIRHASASRIMIHLQYESDSLFLSISDDGRGFQNADSAASPTGHFGIPVMEERARKLGGALKLQTAVGLGTEITVKVPFNALMMPLTHREHHVIRWIGI